MNRWWVVFAAVCGLLVGNGPVMQFTFGTMLPAICREFGWSRGAVSSAMVAGLWMTALVTPLMGLLVDRFGIRAVALPAIAVFSIATASVCFVPASLAAFTALYALMGVAAVAQTPLIYAKAIALRFDTQRGLALGIAMAGVGLGAALVPEFAQALVTRVGWRLAYAGLGALTFALAFPAVALAVGRPMGEKQAHRLATEALPGLSGVQALKTARFWIMAVSFFLVAGIAGGVIAHLVPLLRDRGIPVATATRLLSVAGLALIGGRMLAGFLLDRIHAPYVASVFFTMPLMGIVVLLLSSRPGADAVGTVLIGMGLGAEVDMIAFMLSRYLGMRRFGEIYGYFFAIFMVGAGGGPFLMGASYDRFGSYRPMLTYFAVGLALASLLILRLGTYAYPGHRAAERESAAHAGG